MRKLGILFFAILFFWALDLSYLFYGVRCTYLRGETSAQIDDHLFFEKSEVVSNSPFQLPNGKNYSSEIKNPQLDSVLKKSKSVAFLVVQNDSVRLEKYWDGASHSSLTNSFSMAKSILSVLVGCAIKDGYVKGVDQSIFDFVPEMKTSSYMGHDVKIKHLLNMSSGYDWHENYKRPISVTAKAYYGNDIQELILKRGFIEEPGKTHRYSSGSTQLLGLVLERAVGESVSNYAGDVLWSKIGAKNNALWSLDRQGGREKTFCCFNSNARDFSKIGLLMLNNGVSKHNNKTVISKEYRDWLLSVPSLLDSKKSNDTLVDFYSNSWWVANVLGREVFYARGFLGQFVVVVPSLDLVFVRLGKKDDPRTEFKNKYRLTDNLLFFIEFVIEKYSL